MNVSNVTSNIRLSQLLYGFAFSVATVFAAPALAQAATLSVSPSSGSFDASSTFEVKIQLDTGGTTTSGTDAYLRFDPTALQVVDSVPGSDGTQILPGSLYSQTSYNSVDNSAGKISFSGSKSGGSNGYSGSGTLATITFQAVKEISSTAVTFDYTSGSTTDSNIISQSNSDDILSSVTNGSYTINAASGSSDGSGSSGSGSGSGSDNGASGNGGTDGTGGSGTVAGTGLDLEGYALLTLISLFGAGYFLTRKPKHR